MKNKSFTLNSKELLLVELPEGERVKKHIVSPICIDGNWGGSIDISIELQEWQLIGKISEVTEEQYSKLVEKCWESQFVNHVLFRGHLHNCVDTAKESFFSKLESENIDFILDNTYLFEKVTNPNTN